VIAPPDPPEPPARKAPRPKGARRGAVRGAILVLLPLILIFGAATAALGWYARSSYFVGLSGNEVVIYKGIPGGVLGWNPTIDKRTGVLVTSIPALDQDRVRTNSTRGSHSTAESYVSRLEFAATSTTTTSTTTTTRPKPTTPTTKKKPSTSPTTKPGSTSPTTRRVTTTTVRKSKA
jgi:protein phosphatase